MPGYNFNWINAAIPAGGLTGTRASSSSPSTAITPRRTMAAASVFLPCTANTWHRDNISISPAIPFNIIKADRRYIDSASQPSTSTLPRQPAPTSASPASAKSRLPRLQRWRLPARHQGPVLLPRRQLPRRPRSSYWMPVPTGTKSIQLESAKDDLYQGPFIAKDFALWPIRRHGEILRRTRLRRPLRPRR